MSAPYAVRITHPSGNVLYYTGPSEHYDIRLAHTWIGRDGAQHKADKLQADYGRARIAARVEVVEVGQ